MDQGKVGVQVATRSAGWVGVGGGGGCENL